MDELDEKLARQMMNWLRFNPAGKIMTLTEINEHVDKKSSHFRGLFYGHFGPALIEALVDCRIESEYHFSLISS